MNKTIALSLVFVILALCLLGCKNNNAAKNQGGGHTPDNDETALGDEQSGDNSQSFSLKARVIAVGDKLEVEILESDYAYGIYWVIIANDAIILSSSGKLISASDIKPGDTVNISYNGQTMMSLPPQIVAHKIVVL